MQKLVLLIDADNISSDLAPQIFDKIATLGETITKRAFGNLSVFSGKDGWKEAIRLFAIEAYPQVSNVDRKNTADFSLIINAMDCLASGKYDGFILASSDSDFTSLAQRLRNDNKLVYGIGDERATISFRNACTQFFELTSTCPKNKDNASLQGNSTPEVPLSLAPPTSASTISSSTVSKVPVKEKPSPSIKVTTDFKKIVADLQKWKCKKLDALQNVIKNNLQKTEVETEKILNSMKTRGYISIDENKKITWLDKK